MEIRDQFGDFLRKLRKARGYKAQKDFADVTGISQASISRIENNTQKPEPDTLKVFSKVLNYPYADLMVKAGYWDEDDALGEDIEDAPKNKGNLVYDVLEQERNRQLTVKKPANYFIKSLDLNDDDLLEKFELMLDGKPLTKEEAKGVIAYLRSLRELQQ